MAALSRRDIEMIFRAETDKATRPIAELGKAVKESRSQLESLIEAAKSGDASLDGLADATRDLKKAQDELGTARSLLTSLNTQVGALDKAEARLEAARAKYAALAEQMAATDKPTKRLQASFDAAARAVQGAESSFAKMQGQVGETRSQIEGIIGPVSNFQDAFREVAETSRDIGRGLAVAGKAADDFKAKMASAAEENRKLDADVAFEQQGRSAGLLQSQIDYLSQFENRVELLNQAKKEAAAQDVAFNNALSAREAEDGARRTRELERGIRDAFEEAKKAEQVTAFRKIAEDANASLADVSRFGVSADEGTESATRFADAIRAIIDPAGASRSTVTGLAESVENASKVLEGSGGTLQEYNQALNELSAVYAGLNRIAQQIDGYKAQEQAAAAASAEFDRLRGEAQTLADELATTDEPTAELAEDLRRAEAAAESAGKAMQRQNQRLKELSDRLKQAGVDTRNLAEAEEELEDIADEASNAQDDIEDEAGGGGLFGLSLNDANNLGYQLNDIFTQLASGQSIFTTLAQQGPQIWQIAPVRAYLLSLGPIVPALVAVAAAAGAAYLVLSRMSDQAEEMEQATVYMSLLGEQGSLTAEQMTKASLQMQDFGVEAADAREMLKSFNQDGLDPKYLESFIEIAKDAAEVTGGDFKDAFGLLQGAMAGSFAEVEKLNEAFPVLSEAEMVQIRAMYDSGKEAEAREFVYDRFYDKIGAASDNLNGPWSNAWVNFKNAISAGIDYIADLATPIISGLTNKLDELAVATNYALLRLQGYSSQEAGDAAVNNNGRVRANRPGGDPNSGRANATTAAGQEAIEDARRELKSRKDLTREERLRNAEIEARRNAPSNASDEERSTLAAIGRQKELNAIREEDRKKAETAERKAKAAADKAKREAEALANKIATAQEALQTALDAMGAKVAKTTRGTLEAQLKGAAVAIDKEYDKTYRKVAAFSDLTKGAGTIGGMSIAEYRATLDANKTILQNQAQLGVYEDNVNSTLQERRTILGDIEDRAARGQITSAQAIAEATEVTSNYQEVVVSLSTAAANFARSIGGASPSAELRAYIAKMEAIAARSSGDRQQDARKLAEGVIGKEEAKLNKILSERNSLVESYNTLAQIGIITEDEARRRSAAAYNASATAIAQQSDVMRAALDRALMDGQIDTTAYDALIAKLKVVDAQAQYLDPRFAQLKAGVDGIVSQNILTGLDRMAQAWGNVAAGTMSVSDALRETGLALVSFFADTVQMVAKLILQMLILDAIQKTTGIPVAALLGVQAPGAQGGGSGGGGFRLFGLKLFHGGTDSVGSYASGQQRTNRVSFNPAALSGLPRFHNGTAGVGLKPQEQLAVVERGEKIMTEEQQRREEAAGARAAGGSGGGFKQVLAFGDDQVAAAMAGNAGENVTLTHIRRNAPAIKQLLDGR